MKRFVTFLISFFVIITLCACSANGEAKSSFENSIVENVVENSLEADLVGNWICRIETTDFLNQNSGEYAPYFKFEDVWMAMKLDFFDDGTYSYTYDEKTIQDMINKSRMTYEAGIEKYILDSLAEQGLNDMDFEEFLVSLGMSKDDLLDQMIEQMESSLVEVTGPFEGEYWTDGEILHLLDERNKYTSSDGEKFIFRLNGDTLELSIYSLTYGEEPDTPFSILADFMPFTFVRVS